MARISINGIGTEYDVRGSGPPLLMFAPGGFDATMDKWWSLGIYAKTRPLDFLQRHFSCILFDRRECGASDGRVEALSWAKYAEQGRGLLDHLGFEQAHLIGGCMGVSPVTVFAASYPERVKSMILYWPVGGAKYRINAHQRFADHLGFANANGLGAVIDLVKAEGKSFSGDSRGGPWASSIRTDPEFAAQYAKIDLAEYRLIVSEMMRALFDRDTAPGAEAEAMLRCRIPALIIPGADASHARSAAHYLTESLPVSELWDCPVEDQTAEATAEAIMGFLGVE